MHPLEIAPTVVPESLEDIIAVAKRYESFAHTIHVDVADGIFAPNTTWMPQEGDVLPKGMKFEIHMMVADPREMGLRYARAGAHSLIGHVEAFKGAENADRTYKEWRRAGIQQVQAAALYQTAVEDLAPYVPISDLVLLMTIASIGTQGIPFVEEGIDRVAKFRELYPEARIAVDGGVSPKNIERLSKAGATHFCVGSAISRAPDPKAAYEEVLRLAGAV